MFVFIEGPPSKRRPTKHFGVGYIPYFFAINLYFLQSTDCLNNKITNLCGVYVDIMLTIRVLTIRAIKLGPLQPLFLQPLLPPPPLQHLASLLLSRIRKEHENASMNAQRASERCHKVGLTLPTHPTLPELAYTLKCKNKNFWGHRGETHIQFFLVSLSVTKIQD